MGKGDIQPSAFTLRFKHGKHTILLFAEALTPFATIKSDLLTVLRERYPRGLPSSRSPDPIPIPDNIVDVMLGVPLDEYEPSKGWQELATGGPGIKETPKSLGLKDGSILAFSFIPEGDDDEAVEFEVEWSSYEEQYGSVADEEGAEDESEEELVHKKRKTEM